MSKKTSLLPSIHVEHDCEDNLSCRLGRRISKSMTSLDNAMLSISLDISDNDFTDNDDNDMDRHNTTNHHKKHKVRIVKYPVRWTHISNLSSVLGPL